MNSKAILLQNGWLGFLITHFTIQTGMTKKMSATLLNYTDK